MAHRFPRRLIDCKQPQLAQRVCWSADERLRLLVSTYSQGVEDVTTADRLTLVSQLNAPGDHRPRFLLEPVWIEAGQRYWLDEDDSALIVEDSAGLTTSHPCAFESGPDAVR
jgi:hypothetical protein